MVQKKEERLHSKNKFTTSAVALIWKINGSLPPTAEPISFQFRAQRILQKAKKTEPKSSCYSKWESICYTLSSQYTVFGGFSYQFSLKLNASDKVELFMTFGRSIYLHFTGMII